MVNKINDGGQGEDFEPKHYRKNPGSIRVKNISADQGKGKANVGVELVKEQQQSDGSHGGGLRAVFSCRMMIAGTLPAMQTH